MWGWLKAAQTIHTLLVVLAAIGFFHFAVRTRFWFPRYVHFLAGFALVVGLACVAMIRPDAPISQGQWAWLEKAALVLLLPTLVYVVFVFYGAQQSAYEHRRSPKTVLCPYCRSAQVNPGSPCPNCGQTSTD